MVNAGLNAYKGMLMDRVGFRSPIVIADADTANQRVVLAAFEAQGFRCSLSDGNVAAIKRDEQPLVLVDGAVSKQMDSWLAYANQGGILVLINPNYSVASELGLKEYQGVVSRAVFCFTPLMDRKEICIELFGSISKYQVAPGCQHGSYNTDGEDASYPGIVELVWGYGKIFLILFCLGRYITYLRQRNRSAAESEARGSAERILLSRIDKSYLYRPQIDILMGFLAGIISTELVRADRPFPRFASLPEGKHSMVIFSFDDACPSGSPVRKAWNSCLHFARAAGKTVQKKGRNESFIRRLVLALVELILYPWNYEADLRSLVDLFKMHDARGSIFILPFWGPIKNRPRLTGYRGFSLRAYNLLKNDGWDIGTHIKPGVLGDYPEIQKSFVKRFGALPRGHRGHELGWVGWDEDWGVLEQLNYLYDTTWNWGGYAGLNWIIGTAYPFHPVNQSGYPFSLVEVPVVAWLDDLYRIPQESMRAIEDALSEYPGVYHFAGHTWLIRDAEYRIFVETILKSISQRKHVALGWSLAELSSFWKARETSAFGQAEWDVRNGVLSFAVDSRCHNDQLAVDVPYRWGDRLISEVKIENKEVEFALKEYFGVEYAMLKLQQKLQCINVMYR